ncbi:MAG: EamA family transporter [Candidatus Paceibacterota bacterium]
MITGLMIGIAAAFVWSITNIVDKYLVDEYAQDGNIGGVLLLSCFFPITLLVLSLMIAGQSVWYLPTEEIYTLLLTGFLLVLWIYFYLKALSEDDASVVMTLLVLAPFFSLIFGQIILKEFLTSVELLAGGLMVLGALTVVYEPNAKKIKWKVFGYAIAASVITALMLSLFKFVALEGGAWESLFWRSVGMVFIGGLIYLFISSYRDSFHIFMRDHFTRGVGLNVTNESLTLTGDTLFAVAILFAPLALVQTTEAYQPIFVFLMILIINRFGVRVVQENIEKKVLIQKGIGFVLVLVGTIILSFVS